MSGNRYFSETTSRLTFERLDESAENVLTDEEVRTLESAIKNVGLDYYGVKVNKTEGVFFDVTREGTLYGAEGDLMTVLDTVADTVLFNGMVEIRANDIDEYVRYEITDSIVTDEKFAQIIWV